MFSLLSVLVLTIEASHILRTTITSGYNCYGCEWYGELCASGVATSPMINLISSRNCAGGCPDWAENILPNNRRDVDSATSWSDGTWLSIGVRSNTDYKCGDGYYLFGLGQRCNNGAREGFPYGLWCQRALNLPINWGNNGVLVRNSTNPWGANAGKFNCPVNTYLVGFGVGSSVAINKVSLLCAYPPDMICAPPVDRNTTYVLNVCSTIHQYCVVTVTCKPFFMAGGGSRTAECTNTGAYNRTLLSCVDINECSNSTICGPKSICTNLVGAPGYSCSCVPGYKMVNSVCTNNDECRFACLAGVTNPIASECNDCGAMLCTDTPGNFTCTMPPNPCNQRCTSVMNTSCHNCSATLANCSYTFPAPSYTCTCVSGYSSTDGGRSCSDIDECALSPPCDVSTSRCQNLPGTYSCPCLQGYNQTGPLAPCTPINECQNTALCAGGASQCVDTTPNYYCLPKIIAVKRNAQPTPFLLTSTEQNPPDIVEITVLRESNCVRAAYVSFGVGNLFQTNACIQGNNTSTSYTLSCGMPPGAGANLSFSLQCCLNYTTSSQCVWSSAPALLFSYPKPTLTPLTLTYAGSNNTLGTAVIDSEVSGVVVTMQGTNFFPSQLAVFFGVAADPLAYTCTVITANYSTVTCLPQYVLGLNFSFVVSVGFNQFTQNSARGSDKLSFQGDPPVLSWLDGCTVQGAGPRIIDCPTAGGVNLVITAKTAQGNPLRAPQLFVDGRKCPQSGVLVTTGFNCTLPPGTGTSVSVELRDVTTSWFGAVLSYAIPLILRVFSPNCANMSPLSLVDCTSFPLSIYIEGNNFGASGATIIFNSLILPAQHLQSLPGQSPSGFSGPHRFLAVVISSPTQVVNSLSVQQLNGMESNQVVSFSLPACPAGYRRTNTTCQICGVGRFAYQEGCYLCVEGTYQPLMGQTACVNCSRGYVQGSQGQTNCTACGSGSFDVSPIVCGQCPQGKFSNGTANSVCMECVGGTFSSNLGALGCTDCLPGRYSTPNALVCDDCPAGTVSQTPRAGLCVACPPGTSQSTPGLTYCEDCLPGEYSPGPSSPFCLSCLPGRYHNKTRQTTCELCPVGSSQNQPAADSCVQCEPGTFASTLGATECKDCGAGQYTNLTGASACVLCEPGSAQNTPAAIECDACDVGTFSSGPGLGECQQCQPGFFQNSSGTSFCYLCPVGHFANSRASLECRPCEPGTFQPGMGQQRCFACSPGFYQPSDTSISCLPCAAGTASTSEASVVCAACPAARYSSQQARVCQSCPPSTIQPLPNQPRCLACTSGSSPNELGTRCQCQTGHYSSYTSDGMLLCPTCPQGSGPCGQIGTQFTEITTLPGYWRLSSNTTTFYRCKTPNYCLGGDKCAPFRKGPMCALCIDGYRSGGTGSQCAECPATKEASWGITISICIALLVLLVAMYYIALRVGNAQQQRIIRLVAKNNQIALENLAKSIKPDDEHFDALRRELHGEIGEDFRESDPVAFVRPLPQTLQLADTSRRAPNFMYKVKILIGFFQIASYLPSQGDISWPAAFVDFISAFSFFNFDFIPWQTLGCAAGINYFTKTIIVGFVPVIAIIVLIIFFTFAWCATDLSSLEAQMEKGQRRNAVWRQFVRLVLFTIFLLYPLVSKIAFGVYNCVTVDDVSYLVADFELLCYDDNWMTYAIIDGFFVALYPIGIPIAYFWILHSRLQQMREPETILVLGFLYEAYTESAWYWELVDMTHKLILTSIIVFAPNDQRMAWNMAIMGFYLMSLLIAMPYVRKGDDRFHLQVQATLFAVAFVGFILHQDKPFATKFASPSQMESMIASLLIVIVLALLVSFVVISGRNVRKIYVAHIIAKEEAKKAAIADKQIKKL